MSDDDEWYQTRRRAMAGSATSLPEWQPGPGSAAHSPQPRPVSIDQRRQRQLASSPGCHIAGLMAIARLALLDGHEARCVAMPSLLAPTKRNGPRSWPGWDAGQQGPPSIKRHRSAGRWPSAVEFAVSIRLPTVAWRAKTLLCSLGSSRLPRLEPGGRFA
jgi:hypothetical protein